MIALPVQILINYYYASHDGGNTVDYINKPWESSDGKAQDGAI